jgi:hypothetical protein
VPSRTTYGLQIRCCLQCADFVAKGVVASS